MKKRIGIIGSGSWATALAKIILNKEKHINWYFRKSENIELFKRYHHNPNYLRAVKFDTSKINFYTDVNEIVKRSDIILLAIPSAFIHQSLSGLKEDISKKIIVSAVKGVIPETNQIPGQYLHKKFNVPYNRFCAIVGPCHAEEVALERLSFLTIACKDLPTARDFASILECDYIKVRVSDDITGMEYSSVLKNIIAIASGIVHGLDYGDNFQAILISNAINEIERFVDKAYPIVRDISNPVYLGDLLVTAYSQFSRNRVFGTMIGKGYSITSAQLEMPMIAEGYYATKSIHKINEKYNVDLPICDAVYEILYDKTDPAIVINDLVEKLK